jgi:hypothetical protein
VFSGKGKKREVLPLTLNEESLMKEEERRVEDFGAMLSCHIIECVSALDITEEGKVRTLLSIVQLVRDRVLSGQILINRP